MDRVPRSVTPWADCGSLTPESTDAAGVPRMGLLATCGSHPVHTQHRHRRVCTRLKFPRFGAPRLYSLSQIPSILWAAVQETRTCLKHRQTVSHCGAALFSHEWQTDSRIAVLEADCMQSVAANLPACALNLRRRSSALPIPTSFFADLQQSP